MKAIKLVCCVLVALFTLSSLLRLLVTIPVALRIMNSSASNGSSYAFGQMMGGVFAVVIGVAITLKLWQSAMKSSAPANSEAIPARPPIPDPKGVNYE